MIDPFRAGSEAWPDVVVDREHFAAALARHGAEVTKPIDLYLAVACMGRDRRAIEIVQAMLATEVRFASQKTTATPDQLAEVTAKVARILFVDEEERPAALRGYSARGDLKGYLRVIATRELVRMVNAGRREVGLDDNLIDALVPRTDPEISILRERYRSDVDDALKDAVQTLDDRERALLRYAFVECLTVEEIGTMYGVHRSTASRWVVAAREHLGEAIRSAIAARLKIHIDEVDSIVRLVQSRIDVSLDRALAT
ncbi:MAG: sigma-70 family RNA polymerase sigma factor [Kofleriaceae bacterium]